MKWLLDLLAAILKARTPVPVPGPEPEPVPDPVPAPVPAPVEQRSLTARDLAISTGARIDRAQEHLPHIIATMAEFGIDTPARQAAFLAQIGHESGGLLFLVEVWGPTPAQRRYEGRQDLGNNQTGDGFRYRGRGLIQLTGRDNYRRASAALGVDLLSQPDLLGQSPLADRVAGWFWRSNGCNRFADSGDFEGLTKRINGGLNGYPDRLARWDKARSVIV